MPAPSETPWFKRKYVPSPSDGAGLNELVASSKPDPDEGTGPTEKDVCADLFATLDAPPAPQPPSREFGPLDDYVSSWPTKPPPQQLDRFAIGRGRSGMFPLANASVFAGPGGYFKTSTAVSMCLHVAGGVPFCGHPVEAGGVLFVSLEEAAEDMHRRTGATAVTQFDPKHHANQQERLAVIDLAGKNGALTEAVAGRYLVSSDMVEMLIGQAKAHAKRTGLPTRLIVIDHARLAMAGDGNDSESVTVLMRSLLRVAIETGAAVVLLAHSPKSSLSTQRDDEFTAADVLGSGAFVDLARFVAVMFPPTAAERKRFGLEPEAAKQYIAMRVIKSNFSEAGRVLYFRKVPVAQWDVAVPEPVDLQPPPPAVRSGTRDVDERVFAYVLVRPGTLTADKLAKTCAGNDGPLKAGRPMIKAAVQRLLDNGRLELRPLTPADRANGELSARSSHALHAVPAP